jgi:hypothetical protein
VEARNVVGEKGMPAPDLPITLAKSYDRVDGLPKNQRFVLGTRLADGVGHFMELLAEATHARGAIKTQLLAQANRRIESVRWLVPVCTMMAARCSGRSTRVLEPA